MNDEAPSSSSSSPDPGTAATPGQQPDLLRKIESATNRAVDQHNAETKRKPGQRGPDKGPRRPKTVSVAGLDDGPRSPLSAPDAPVDDQNVWNAPAPVVDEDTARALGETIVEALLDTRATINRYIALRITGDPAVAEANVPTVSDGLRKTMNYSGLLCARKWLAKIQLEPEWMLFGSYAFLLIGDAARNKMLKRDTNRIRTTDAAA